MIKAQKFAFAAFGLLVSATALQAQTGCSDSPEAPTALLMLAGGVGMFYGSSVLGKALRRLRKK